jgi:hypothetical protein
VTDTDIDTTYEWAVRVHGPIRDVPGPHILECADHGLALLRLEWWQTNRPDFAPELLRRTVVVIRNAWEQA